MRQRQHARQVLNGRLGLEFTANNSWPSSLCAPPTAHDRTAPRTEPLPHRFVSPATGSSRVSLVESLQWSLKRRSRDQPGTSVIRLVSLGQFHWIPFPCLPQIIKVIIYWLINSSLIGCVVSFLVVVSWMRPIDAAPDAAQDAIRQTAGQMPTAGEASLAHHRQRSTSTGKNRRVLRRPHHDLRRRIAQQQTLQVNPSSQKRKNDFGGTWGENGRLETFLNLNVWIKDQSENCSILMKW